MSCRKTIEQIAAALTELDRLTGERPLAPGQARAVLACLMRAEIQLGGPLDALWQALAVARGQVTAAEIGFPEFDDPRLE